MFLEWRWLDVVIVGEAAESEDTDSPSALLQPEKRSSDRSSVNSNFFFIGKILINSSIFLVKFTTENKNLRLQLEKI